MFSGRAWKQWGLLENLWKIVLDCLWLTLDLKFKIFSWSSPAPWFWPSMRYGGSEIGAKITANTDPNRRRIFTQKIYPTFHLPTSKGSSNSWVRRSFVIIPMRVEHVIWDCFSFFLRRRSYFSVNCIFFTEFSSLEETVWRNSDMFMQKIWFLIVRF